MITGQFLIARLRLFDPTVSIFALSTSQRFFACPRLLASPLFINKGFVFHHLLKESSLFLLAFPRDTDSFPQLHLYLLLNPSFPLS